MRKHSVLMSQFDSIHTEVYLADVVDIRIAGLESHNRELDAEMVVQATRIQELEKALRGRDARIEALQTSVQMWEAEARRLGCKWPVAE